MKRVSILIVVAAGLTLTLGAAPSWAGPPNNDVSDASGNTAGGTSALFNTTGGYNTGFGFYALYSDITGRFNTGFGFAALYSNTTGNSNTASGTHALYRNTTGSNNTASGPAALLSNTTGSYNTASGTAALYSNTTGDYNTASAFALYMNTTGINNTASGTAALLSNTTGSNNTALGVYALQDKITGSDNIALGSRAGQLLTSGNQNIYLGNPGASTESNTMRLGSALQTRTFIGGIASAQVSGTMVLINSSGQLGIPVSSARYKRDIQALGARSRGLLKLRPVTFRYRQDPEGLRQYGLLAEEVAGVYPELVTRGAQGRVEAVRYQELIPLLLNELQHQTRQLAELKAQNESLRVALVQQGAAQRALTDVLAVRLEQLEAAAPRAATLARR